MRKLKYIFLFISINSISPLHAQQKNDQAIQIVEDAVEMSAESINENGQDEIPDELQDLARHPIDLNTDDARIFVRINILTELHAQALDDYKKKMGNLIALQELQQIEGFDKKTIMTIVPYCTVNSMRSESQSTTLTLRMQKSLKHMEENFPGPDEKILFRIKTVLSSSLSFSFTAEKDAGEELFTKQKNGFDFSSFNICYKGNRFIRKLMIGDFNLEFGQGLTEWSGLSFGASGITGVYKSGRGIVPYSGTDENRFYRGIAISIQRTKFTIDSWISYHAIDGNVILDSISGEDYITALQTSGYHRTPSENADFHSQIESAAGFSLNYKSGNITTGLVASFRHFAIPINISDDPYKKYTFNGNENYNIGWNYTYSYKNMIFFGENSMSRNTAFALLNGIIMSMHPRLSISYVWRSYSKNYMPGKSNAFGTNTTNSNELGNYFGINYKIIRSITYSGYMDLYSFPFIKYRVDMPSSGFDYFNQLDYTPTKKFNAQFRYRNRLKQLNSATETSHLNKLSDFRYKTYRLAVRFKIDDKWEYSFRTEISSQSVNKIHSGTGTMISQDLFYHPMGKPYSMNCRYAVFNCNDFESRIYEYENDVQGAFSIPFYYGSGSRFYTNVNYKISRNISCSFRYAITWLDNNETDDGTSDIKLQIKTVFN